MFFLTKDMRKDQRLGTNFFSKILAQYLGFIASETLDNDNFSHREFFFDSTGRNPIIQAIKEIPPGALHLQASIT
jgi:hypothetical protein